MGRLKAGNNDSFATVSEPSVKLQLPASSAYLVLARTAVAAMCARLDYPLDRLEDVKLAVDEACSLLLSDTDPNGQLDIELAPTEAGHLSVQVSSRTLHGKAPKQTSFAWTVLTALVDQVSAGADDGIVSISLQASRGSTAVAS